MVSPKDQQLAWVRAILAHLGGISANELAQRAKIAPSTIQRPLNEPDWPNALSGTTMAKIAAVAGLQPLEFPPRSGGLGEPEATPFQYDQDANAIGSNLDRAVRELCRGRNGRDPWVMRSRMLEMSGILPGDILIVDLNLQPRPKDIVCAQMYQWPLMKAETVFRVYEPPYLLTNSGSTSRPVPVDDQDVIIRGVVDGLIRPRQ
ncbi:MAG: helix-turn-helix domain-containing protein [Mesorhizobium sp.]|uniref:helix-turn-helix domain-containing protein n=1 Tax=Mesorhizobium sp. TaxID=1871066 RepID=UPI000FE90458|nr:helix-turn-helix domain-containing protein [Mesorhizobium sp.]RWN20376.1 MAG: helix-turn-helix domain-containing protein [Mesorhizobium sp.]RWN47156.1 MAG: helix-turn-helix domain-containing protein [Mesorhizobium sp.]